MTGSNFFINPTQGKITIEKMVDELVNFMGQEDDYFYSLVIGTDSKSGKPDSREEIGFVTAVVIHRKGKGGRYFGRKKD